MNHFKQIGLSIALLSVITGCGEDSTPVVIEPKILEQKISLNENRNQEIILIINDKKVDVGEYELVDKPQHGRFEQGKYVANKGYVGEDAFTFIYHKGKKDALLSKISVTVTADLDGDNISNELDNDDDGDGVLDTNDAFPLNGAETLDTDGDGTGNNADRDDDGDGVADTADAFPLNAGETLDTDGDGTGNNADRDDDGDGVDDTHDAFPLNAGETLDTDGDGTGNNADSDDDGDGVADTDDAFPLNSAETLDTDGDGTGNNADSDDDGDGVADTDDIFPLNSAETLDTDGDGIGNNADTDDDGDGISDVDEISNGTDPLTPNQPVIDLVTISGKIEYERINPLHEGGGSKLDDSNITVELAKRVMVKAISSSGVALESVSTNDNGEYAFTQIPKDTEVKIRVYAKMFDASKWDVKVIDNQNGNAQYVLEGALVNVGSSHTVRNLKARASTKNAPPFVILDSVYTSMKKVLEADSSVVFPTLNMNWSTQNITTGSYYDGNATIMLQGDQNGDSDEYDNHIIVHEWGHYFEKKFSRSDSIGGRHGGGNTLDIRVAFGEGWGNAWSAIATDDPLYYDTVGNTGWNMNIEGALQNNPGWFSEASIQRILYDLYDSRDDGQDSLSLGFKPLYDVFVGAEKSTSAFTSIFSFITALKSENEPERGGIDNIVGAENIANISDSYGTGRSTKASSYPYVNYDTLGSNLAISVSDLDGGSPTYGFNKLSNRRYVKFSIASEGNYLISVSQVNETNADPDFYLYKSSPSITYIGESTGNPNSGVESNSFSLSEGDYLLDVVNWNNIGSVEFNLKIDSN